MEEIPVDNMPENPAERKVLWKRGIFWMLVGVSLASIGAVWLFSYPNFRILNGKHPGFYISIFGFVVYIFGRITQIIQKRHAQNQQSGF